MRCHAVRRRLSALLDGELTERERARCLSHLEICPSCREQYQQLLEIQRATAVLEEAPLGLESRILDAVRRKERAVESARRRRVWPAPVMLGAAAALIFCVWAVSGLPSQSNEPPVAQQNSVAEASLFSQGNLETKRNSEALMDTSEQKEREIIEEYHRVYSVKLDPDESANQAVEVGFVLKLAVEDRLYFVGDASLISQLSYGGFAGMTDQNPGDCLLVVTINESESPAQ